MLRLALGEIIIIITIYERDYFRNLSKSRGGRDVKCRYYFIFTGARGRDQSFRRIDSRQCLKTGLGRQLLMDQRDKTTDRDDSPKGP